MAPSVAELVANRFLLKIIGATGVFPIVLDLCTIRCHQTTVDWFLLIASSCCVLVAIATWSFASTLSFIPGQLQDIDTGLPSCGKSNPMRFCFGDLAIVNTYDTWLEDLHLLPYKAVFLSGPAMVVPLLVLVGLAATKFRTIRIREYVRGNVYEWALSRMMGNGQERSRDRYFRKNLPILVTVLECWLVITSIGLRVTISLLMAPVADRQDSWGLGQIIAVAVWVPVLVNWLHLLYRTFSRLDL